jgi:hypothetical protein
LEKWVDVVIDDRLPTRDGRLIYARSDTTNVFWTSLLEKAYAKFRGSYQALKDEGKTDVMIAFTGNYSLCWFFHGQL